MRPSGTKFSINVQYLVGRLWTKEKFELRGLILKARVRILRNLQSVALAKRNVKARSNLATMFPMTASMVDNMGNCAWVRYGRGLGFESWKSICLLQPTAFGLENF